jgi:hypothetical protein
MTSRDRLLIALGALVIGVALSTPVPIQADCGPDIIDTVAGGSFGDGGLATGANLDYPRGVAVGIDGSFYIADSSHHRIRKVDTAGIISTVAGTGDPGYSGDGGPAVEACLDHPYDVAVGADGSLVIADAGNHRIRKVDRAGAITTVAGNGQWGYSGDGGPAMDASLAGITGVAVGADGSLYIADEYNHRIRKVSPGPCCEPACEPSPPVAGEAATLHANASAGGGMTACQWDFGDGAQAGGCELTHVYSSPGQYLACVTVTNDAGVSHTCCTTVAVTCGCDVGLVPFWCRMPRGKVGQRRPGHIAARNRGSQPCEVVLRVRNGAGSVVFETTRTLAPLRWTRVGFVHTFTPEDAGSNRWTWEVWPVACDERTPGDNVLEQRVRVTGAPR